MLNLRTALARHRAVRAVRRRERAFRHVLAVAPTVESVHELASLRTRD
jgi:hypothetical protein